MPKTDLFLTPSFLNAAGSLGFAPDLHGPVDWKRFGAFITNPVSLEPRRPASSAVCLEYPGGFLIHSGYPNPGLTRAIHQYASAWARAPMPILIALLIQMLEEVPAILERLESLPNVIGVEIGLPVNAQPGDLLTLIQQSFGELAVVIRFPLDRAFEFIPGEVSDLLAAGLTAVSLGPPRGALPDQTGRVVYGRLFGPGLFPQTLAVARQLVKTGLPVLAGPGVFSASQAEILLANGVTAAQLDAVLWKDPGFKAWDRQSG